jgi:hypothetical protein
MLYRLLLLLPRHDDRLGRSDIWVNEAIGTGSGAIGYGGTMPFVAAPLA